MKRILLIEDDSAQRQLLKTALQHAGYEVVEASNGQEGLQRYSQQPYDLIITDIFMPQEDGIETVFELKTSGSKVKIIAISGGGSWAQHGRSLGADDALAMVKKFGADRTLKKPIKIQQLLVVVDDLLNVRKDQPISPEDHSTPAPNLSETACKKRILVIEDDPSQRNLFKTTLQQAGYEVLEASDGQTGLQVYHQQPCDLIITDIFMPQEDGIETVFELKTSGSKVKVIAISGGGSWAQHGRSLGADDALDIARKFGADRTLKKPVKLRQLLHVVEDLLKIKF